MPLLQDSQPLQEAAVHSKRKYPLFLLMNKIIYASNSNYQLIDYEFNEIRQEPVVLVFVPSSKEDYVFKERQESELIQKLNLNLSKVISLDDSTSNQKWQEAIQSADVLYLHGGNPLVFLEYIKEKEVFDAIKSFTGLMIGISAGAMLLSDTICLTPSNDEYTKFVVEKALSRSTLNIFPHMNFKEVVSSATITMDGLMRIEDLVKLSSQVEIDLLADNHFIILENNQLRYIGDYFYKIKQGRLYQLVNDEFIEIEITPTKQIERVDVSYFTTVYNSMEEALILGKSRWLFNLDVEQLSQSIELSLLGLKESGLAYQQVNRDDFKSWLIDHPQCRYCSLSLSLVEGRVIERLSIRTRYMKLIENLKVFPSIS